MSKAPFPYFGGKARVAAQIWERIGSVTTYAEPFAGSAAVFLAQPDDVHVSRHVLNDENGFIANVWRAIKMDPELVIECADWPAFEVDLRAREKVLREAENDLVRRLKDDPGFYDARLAGWWIWGQSNSISGNWLSARPRNARPDSVAKGANARDGLRRIEQAAERLRTARILCGDWSRCVTNAVLSLRGTTTVGVVLDPPYGTEDRNQKLYGRHENLSVSSDVREWAIANGNDPRFRIALCGYEGEHDMPPSWPVLAWDTGGQANRGTGSQNGRRERVWFSPHCLPAVS